MEVAFRFEKWGLGSSRAAAPSHKGATPLIVRRKKLKKQVHFSVSRYEIEATSVFFITSLTRFSSGSRLKCW